MVALIGGLLLGGLVGNVITGAFLAGASVAEQLAAWFAAALACGGAAAFVTALRLRRLESTR